MARSQLRSLGLSEEAIDHAVRTARLHRTMRGVFAFGHPASGEKGRAMAATLACGEGTVVSHRSAGALLGLLERAPIVVDVIAEGERGRKLQGVRAHRAPSVSEGEAVVVDGIPCTGPSRTIADLAGVIGRLPLRGAFERAAVQRLLDPESIAAMMRPGRRGNRVLRELLAEWSGAGAVKLRSAFEARVLSSLRRHGLPAPACNARLRVPGAWLEVDFLWDPQRLVAELDGHRFHSDRASFERDRRRDRLLSLAGYRVLRITWRQFELEEAAVIDAIRTLLGPR